MILLELDPETYEVKINKPWVMLIPELAALIRRDKGSPGDHDGRKKLKARKELSFIYLTQDFSSPISSREESEKRQLAMDYTGLTERDMDEVLLKANQTYKELLYKASPALETLASMRASLHKFNEYYRNLDFTTRDKQGKLLYTPNEFLKSTKDVGPAFDTLDLMEKKVIEQLKNDSGIRGSADKGDNEGKDRGEWKEGKSDKNANIRTYAGLGSLLDKDEEIDEHEF
jgi:hypothetical protein